MPLAHPRNARKRPTPTVDRSWATDAACRDTPLDLWFGPDGGESETERSARESEALAICGRCDVRTDCLDAALTTRDDDGIAGGMVGEDRRRLRRRTARRAS